MSSIPTVVATVIATIAATPIPTVIPALIPSIPTEVVSMPGWIVDTIKFVTSVKGMGLGAGIVALCQLVIKGLSTSYFSEKAGKYKLLALYILATVGTVGGFVLSGVPLVGALISGPALAMFQNALDQLFKQFVTKSNEGK